MARRLPTPHKPRARIVLAYLIAEEVTDFQNRMHTVLGHLQRVPGVQHAAVFQERNHRRAALTSRSFGCHETPPNGVDIPSIGSRFRRTSWWF
jgi:hypothetical protein